jgi:von Willebrand factor type A domain/Aerotolerance regulator N-terminal
VRRASRERLLFSTLMFLRPAPPRMTRRNRIEHVFLMLLRCLAICILAVGFARPFLQKPMSALPTTATGARTILLVDTSASMKREGLWPDALGKAEAAIHRAAAADQLAILAFDNQVRTLVSFEDWGAMGLSERAALAAQRLKDTKPTWRSTHMGNALIAAADLIEDADKREQHLGPRRIIIVTDFQEGARLDGLQGHPWPRRLEVVLEPVKSRRPTNASIQWVTDADDSARPGPDAPSRIRVSNSADATREQFQIRWAGTGDAPALDAYVPPGQSRTMPTPALPTGLPREQILLSGDDNDFDNSTYIVQPKTEEVCVRYFGDDLESDPSQLLYYLERAFQNTRRQTVRIITAGVTNQPPGQPNLAPANAGACRLQIVTSALSGDALAEVRGFIGEGGTVLFVMKDAASVRTLGQLANAPDLSATEASVANYAMFGQLDFQHPLLAPFSDPRFSDFTKIRFWKHRVLAVAAADRARVVARFDDNSPAIAEVPAGRGRILVFAFSWRPADGQFALSSKFVPMLFSILEQAAGLRGPVAQYRVGEPVDLSALAAKSPAGHFSVRVPGGGEVQLAAEGTRFTQTDQPGVYEVLAGQSPIRFAVNLDPAESKTAPLPLDTLERLGLPMKAAQEDVAQVAAQQKTLRGSELEQRQKLWRWLILAALVVLSGETWLAGWITRRSASVLEPAA